MGFDPALLLLKYAHVKIFYLVRNLVLPLDYIVTKYDL